MSRRKRAARQPIDDPPMFLRQRQRADGSWRIWWEPSLIARAMGFSAVELDGDRLTWSVRQAQRLNREFENAEGNTRRNTGRTIADLIHNYRLSPAFTRDLSEKSRQSYRLLLRPIEAKWGDHLVADFTKPDMVTWYETLLGTGKLRMAQALLRMMSILFSRAEAIGWRAENSNPCQRLKMRTPQPRARAAGWPELDALVRTADELGMPSIGTACLMLALQGQRSTDVRKARLSHFRLARLDPAQHPTWIWVITRQKRTTEGAMRLHPELEARLHPLLLRDAETDDRTIIVNDATGRAYGEDLFIRHFNRVRDQAALRRASLRGLQMRDLRRTFGVLARQAGASREDVGDVLGNSAAVDPRLSETYMPPSVHTASRAVLAIQRPHRKERKSG
ncbi:MAG: hypothetical protein ACK4LQ_02245 [Pararhodobacter sp.]